MAEAEGIEAQVQAHNAISNANLTADVIRELWPELIPQLPSIVESLAPQPGVLGDARVYAFPGGNGNGNGSGIGDINKLMLSTSGLALINSLLEEGKLGTLINQVRGLAGQAVAEPEATGNGDGAIATDSTTSTEDVPHIDETHPA